MLRLTTGLFRDVCRRWPPSIRTCGSTASHVDAMAAMLVRRPADFDVVVTENLFGDILSIWPANLPVRSASRRR